jgi:hypothetical protein
MNIEQTNKERGTRIKEQETWNREYRTDEQGSRNKEQETRIKEQESWNKNHGTGNIEQMNKECGSLCASPK